jgi:hypothetical protein
MHTSTPRVRYPREDKVAKGTKQNGWGVAEPTICPSTVLASQLRPRPHSSPLPFEVGVPIPQYKVPRNPLIYRGRQWSNPRHAPALGRSTTLALLEHRGLTFATRKFFERKKRMMPDIWVERNIRVAHVWREKNDVMYGMVKSDSRRDDLFKKYERHLKGMNQSHLLRQEHRNKPTLWAIHHGTLSSEYSCQSQLHQTSLRTSETYIYWSKKESTSGSMTAFVLRNCKFTSFSLDGHGSQLTHKGFLIFGSPISRYNPTIV